MGRLAELLTVQVAEAGNSCKQTGGESALSARSRISSNMLKPENA
jgi:hypothetical protein